MTLTLIVDSSLHLSQKNPHLSFIFGCVYSHNFRDRSDLGFGESGDYTILLILLSLCPILTPLA